MECKIDILMLVFLKKWLCKIEKVGSCTKLDRKF